VPKGRRPERVAILTDYGEAVENSLQIASIFKTICPRNRHLHCPNTMGWHPKTHFKDLWRERLFLRLGHSFGFGMGVRVVDTQVARCFSPSITSPTNPTLSATLSSGL